MMFVLLFVEAFYAFGFVFVVCELCERVSQGFNDINDVFNECNYLLFPIELQRLAPIAVIFTQQPMEFNFFGRITCSRECFKLVNLVDPFVFLKQNNSI